MYQVKLLGDAHRRNGAESGLELATYIIIIIIIALYFSMTIAHCYMN